MIKISVDESVAYDMLAILECKIRAVKELVPPEKLVSSFLQLNREIANSIGYPMYLEILQSKEYLELIGINTEVFQLVDLAKTNSCTAKEVDQANYERYLKKKALQEKFFPDKVLTEIKIGYEIKD